jgi:hypothetical protein
MIPSILVLAILGLGVVGCVAQSIFYQDRDTAEHFAIDCLVVEQNIKADVERTFGIAYNREDQKPNHPDLVDCFGPVEKKS